MATVKVEKNNYTVESFYQWDKDQTLEVYGLSLASVPEIHFTNVAMSRAIVRQASMDAAGVVRVEVPNSLLQKAYTIQVYVCTYAGSTFETQYKLEIPVKARTQPADYTLEDDPEVYSFNALENQVQNVLTAYAEVDKKHQDAVAAQKAAETAYKNAKNDVDEAVADAAKTAVESLNAGDVGTYSKVEVLGDRVKTALGLNSAELPDAAFSVLSRLHSGLGNDHIWKRSKVVSDPTPAYYELGDTLTNVSILRKMTGEPFTTAPYQYSSEITVNDGGGVMLVNPVTVNADFYPDYLQPLIGNYCVAASAGNTHLVPGAVYYIPADAVIERAPNDVVEGHQWNSITVSKIQRVFGYAKVEAGEHVEFVNSPDPTAYPPAVADGYAYTYLGQLGEKKRVAYGSYTGTGAFGEAAPNTLTFDFTPTYFIILASYEAGSTAKNGGVMAYSPTNGVGSSSVNNVLCIPAMLDYFAYKMHAIWSGSDPAYAYARKLDGGKTIQWYNTEGGSGAIFQFNKAGVVYYWCAIE